MQRNREKGEGAIVIMSGKYTQMVIAMLVLLFAAQNALSQASIRQERFNPLELYCGKSIIRGDPSHEEIRERLRKLESTNHRCWAAVGGKQVKSEESYSRNNYSKETSQALERVSNGLAQKQADAATRRIREQRLQKQREAEARRVEALARQKELIEKSRRRLAACKRVGRGSCAKPI